MPAWSRKADGRCKAVSAAVNIHSMHQVRQDPSPRVRREDRRLAPGVGIGRSGQQVEHHFAGELAAEDLPGDGSPARVEVEEDLCGSALP